MLCFTYATLSDLAKNSFAGSYTQEQFLQFLGKTKSFLHPRFFYFVESQVKLASFLYKNVLFELKSNRNIIYNVNFTLKKTELNLKM